MCFNCWTIKKLTHSYLYLKLFISFHVGGCSEIIPFFQLFRHSFSSSLVMIYAMTNISFCLDKSWTLQEFVRTTLDITSYFSEFIILNFNISRMQMLANTFRWRHDPHKFQRVFDYKTPNVHRSDLHVPPHIFIQKPENADFKTWE